MNICLIFGTRPQIIKSVPVMRECKRRNIPLTIINTGQHYDYAMNKVFFDNFALADPQYDLGIGSGSHAEQTGNIMIATEKALLKIKPDVCVIPGDTNSAIGSCLASVKIKIPVAHLEAGLRSGEEFMAEEINRIVIDHCSRLLYAPTQNAKDNLIQEGVSANQIILTGDTMYDLYLSERSLIDSADLPDDRLEPGKFILMTLHRQENTEGIKVILRVLEAVKDLKVKTVFPMHPRTLSLIEREGLTKRIKQQPKLVITPPLHYHQMMRTMRDASIILTDSGGVQKEAFMNKVPCITLRHSTEWIETVEAGGNVLLDEFEVQSLKKTIGSVLRNREKIISKMNRAKSLFGNGKAAERIVRSLLHH